MVQQRQISQTLIHKLVLNPMRSNTENSILVAWSDCKDKLINWYNSQKAPEPYTDNGSPSFECQGDSHSWYKVFSKGTELEWFNPADSLDNPNRYGQGIQEEWVDDTIIPNITVGFRVW